MRLIANRMVVTARSVSKSIAWYQRLAWETVGAFAPAWRRRRHGDPGDPRVSLMEERLTRIIPDRTRTSVEMVTLVTLSGPSGRFITTGRGRTPVIHHDSRPTRRISEAADKGHQGHHFDGSPWK